jgi:tripartite-type tricarboxylate transporter receptor subunit TctC
MNKRPFLRCAAAALAAAALAGAGMAQAQPYPNKPIRIIIGFAPGAITDTVARTIGAKLASSMGQSVVIENRSGAGGTLAADAVAHAAPDGYTLFLGEPGSMAINTTLMDVKYSPTKDLVAIGQVINTPVALVAYPGFGVNKLSDLANVPADKVLAYGSAGSGTIQHLSTELFRAASKLPLVHVPYRGGAPALNDLISGQTPLLAVTVPTIAPYLKSGKVVPLALFGPNRSALMPDVPTFAQAGYNLPVGTPWQGFFAPAGTPPDLVAKLNAEIRKAVNAPDVHATLLGLGCEIVLTSPDEFAKLLNDDIGLWGRAIQVAGVKKGG